MEADADPHAAVPESRAVLVLEDDPDVSALCAELLRGAGFAVLECPNLAAALAAVEVSVPDILLLDRELPDGNGLDVARWVRRRPALNGVRLIGFSGRTSADDRADAAAAGCDAFVAKPCSPETLLSAMTASSRR